MRNEAVARIGVSAIVVLALMSVSAPAASADAVADFYKGKVLTIVIGYAAGGFDLYARLLGRFLGKHIPGHPTIIAQNRPGAGSRNAANWLYNIAPPDGTVIATLSQTTPTDQALGEPGIQFNSRNFNWIGNMVVINNILFVNASTGVTTLADATKKVLAIGATGASSPSILYPQVSNNVLGTKFKIVSGYPGSAEINLAMERNEVDGHGSNSWASVKSERPDWVRNHVVNVLFQVGLKRETDLPDVPLWTELAQNDDQRRVLEVLSGFIAVGRPFLTAPNVPADRVKALRQAFDDTMKDPLFVDAARTANMYLNPLGGDELQKVVENIIGQPPTVIAQIKRAVEVRDAEMLKEPGTR
jgi:tripartite-type tricarboxylate transporter receptor subunit TctC